MPIEHRTGDLFNQPDLTALAHGVNCKGLMGAGIAVVFKRKYPDMFAQYQTRCAFDGLQVGDCMPWFTHDGNVIFNLATQYKPGPHAQLDGVEYSLFSASSIALNAGIHKIGLPRIGAGIGGLKWEDVEHSIKLTEGIWPEITYVIVTLPEGN